MFEKKIGIWGFGAVGRSALAYFAQQGAMCTVLDKRTLSNDEQQLLAKYNATYFSEKKIDDFFSHNDFIFASPGIDINPHKHLAHFVCELDIFAPTWNKQIIAITGTVGKTSTTTLLGKLLQKTLRIAVGGNIGTPMLNFLDQKNNFDYALLELSSWQLEHAQPFAPDVAIWTNFSPNHLDRHHTMEAYFNAKLQIMLHQTARQTTIVPVSLYDRIMPLNLTAKKIWIDDTNNNHTLKLATHDKLLYIENNSVAIKSSNNTIILGDINTLPHCTYMQNMLIAAAVLHTLHMPFELLTQIDIAIEHRLEMVARKKNVTFYNDSKATVPESTLAALAQFKNNNVILFLGGLSKGVDRTDLVRALPAHIKKVICFGSEAQALRATCTKNNIASIAFDTLKDAFDHATHIAHQNDIILLSPSGSSYDLYADYAERGRHFKQLVHEYTND